MFPGKRFSARPTTDFAKESLFNIINNHYDIETVRVLDLFSGTGSISFEFASRGCQSIDAVENNRHHYAFIKKTAEELGFQRMKIHYTDAFSFIRRCKTRYDLVFADPPYDLPGIPLIPGLVFEHGLLHPGGWLILEHSSAYHFENTPFFSELRRYGSVHFSVFEQSG